MASVHRELAAEPGRDQRKRSTSEEGPGWNEIEEAIEWARSHAPIVYVRLGQGLSEIYNAGETDGDAQRSSRALAGSAARERAGNVHPRLRRRRLCRRGACRCSSPRAASAPFGDRRRASCWRSGGALRGSRGGGRLGPRACARRARRRAPTVVEPRPRLRDSLRGGREPPGDPLERLRPRRGHETMEWSFTTQEDGERDRAGRVQPGARGSVAQGRHGERSRLPRARGASPHLVTAGAGHGR